PTCPTRSAPGYAARNRPTTAARTWTGCTSSTGSPSAAAAHGRRRRTGYGWSCGRSRTGSRPVSWSTSPPRYRPTCWTCCRRRRRHLRQSALVKTFEELYAELAAKAAARTPGSSTVAALDKGVHFIGKKVVEEAAESWMAAE